MVTVGLVEFRKIQSNQQSMAAKLGVRQGTISKWRSGHSTPDATSRLAIQIAYKIPVEAWDKRADLMPKKAA